MAREKLYSCKTACGAVPEPARATASHWKRAPKSSSNVTKTAWLMCIAGKNSPAKAVQNFRGLTPDSTVRQRTKRKEGFYVRIPSHSDDCWSCCSGRAPDHDHPGQDVSQSGPA